MLELQTIKTLVLNREIHEPKSASEMFHNSDKPWSDASLGKNLKAMQVAFTATQIAVENLSIQHTAK